MTNENLKNGEMSSMWLDSNNNKRLLQLEYSMSIGLITIAFDVSHNPLNRGKDGKYPSCIVQKRA